MSDTAPAPIIPPCQYLTADDLQEIRQIATRDFGATWLHHYPRLIEAALLKKVFPQPVASATI